VLPIFFVKTSLYPTDIALNLNRKPYRYFVNILYIGSVGVKKLSKNSQYAHNLDFVTGVKKEHSQIGDGYDLAKLGDISELFDRLAKYDRIDLPPQEEPLNFTLNYFIGWIGKCKFLDITVASNQMNAGASSGFGAKRAGIRSRNDPKMKQYLEDYINLAAKGDVKCIISGSQKDELRVNGKTPRLFTSYPPEHTFLSTIVLGNFVKQFYTRSFSKDFFVSAIGDSPQNGSMKLYFDKLSERKFAYCTDTSAQDSSVPVWFIEAVFNEIMKKYDLDEEDLNLFNNAKSNSIYKVMNVAGYIYLVPRGLGSGDYLTTIMNVMWRFYMVVENYKRPLSTFFEHNTVVINGDDLAMSSDFDDLDLSSKYAGIEWAGKPVPWEDMDFCSCRFVPDVHFDSLKMRSVLDKRVQKCMTLHPEAEMERLGGLLRIHVDIQFYDEVLSRMRKLRDQYSLFQEFERSYASYSEVWMSFNIFV
jgi:hypothetical protein